MRTPNPTKSPLLYSRATHHAHVENTAQRLSALFFMLGIIALLLWFLE